MRFLLSDASRASMRAEAANDHRNANLQNQARPALPVPGDIPLQVYSGNWERDRKSTRLNSSHGYISYAVFCLKKKKIVAAVPSPPSSAFRTELRTHDDQPAYRDRRDTAGPAAACRCSPPEARGLPDCVCHQA